MEEYMQYPTTFVSDYEQGMRKAAKEVWPGVVLPGCAFHFNQTIRRNYMKRVFPKPRKGSHASHAHSKVKSMFMNLQYLPHKKIKRGFRAIGLYQINNGIAANFREFNDYFNNYWMRKVKPRNFSKHRSDHRTNNICESFNNQMNASLPPNPNMYNFLHVMKLHIIEHNQKDYENYVVESEITENVIRAWDDLDHHLITVANFIEINFYGN